MVVIFISEMTAHYYAFYDNGCSPVAIYLCRTILISWKSFKFLDPVFHNCKLCVLDIELSVSIVMGGLARSHL